MKPRHRTIQFVTHIKPHEDDPDLEFYHTNVSLEGYLKGGGPINKDAIAEVLRDICKGMALMFREFEGIHHETIDTQGLLMMVAQGIDHELKALMPPPGKAVH